MNTLPFSAFIRHNSIFKFFCLSSLLTISSIKDIHGATDYAYLDDVSIGINQPNRWVNFTSCTSFISQKTPPSLNPFSQNPPPVLVNNIDDCPSNIADLFLATPCYVNGARTNNANEGAIVAFNYATRGQGQSLDYLANISEVGTVWGLEFNSITNDIFTSAFVKRHADLAPDGLGAIYITDTKAAMDNGPATGATQLWLDINDPSAFLDTGGTPVNLGFPNDPGAASRELGAKSAPSHDVWAYDKVGRQGIGDIAFSRDFTRLYVMDLTNKQLLIIDVATKRLIAAVAVPDPGCNNSNDVRPWAVQEYHGEVYIGVACSGETSQVNPGFSIMKLDDINNPTAFSTEFFVSDINNRIFTSWQPWPTDHDNHVGTNLPNYHERPSPFISDIEFDALGNMIIGIGDIAGHLYGHQNYPPTNDNYTFGWLTTGEITRAEWDGSNWNPIPLPYSYAYETRDHLQAIPTFIGGLETAACADSAQVIGNVVDPYEDNSAGAVWTNADTGDKEGGTIATSALEIIPNINAPDNFGKAAGLGDLSLFSIDECELGPLVTLDWSAIPFQENETIPTAEDTYIDPVDYEDNPYHGFADPTGNISDKWLEQYFANLNNSGIDVTLNFSPNSYDSGTLEGPDRYGPTGTDNPDCRVMGDVTLRMVNDRNGTITPFTAIISFSKPVIIEEFIVGSLSNVGSAYEHAVVRAFTEPVGQGQTVPASIYQNISNLDDDAALIHDQGNNACAIQNNDINNLLMESPSANATYHVMGTNSQGSDNFGRIKFGWNEPIQSIAMSTWMTGTADLDDDNYLGSPHSVIFAPVSFRECLSCEVEITEVKVNCIDPSPTLEAIVNWSDVIPENENIEVSFNGATQTINVQAGAISPDTLTFSAPTDGNNYDIIAQFETTTTCTDTLTYNAPLNNCGLVLEKTINKVSAEEGEEVVYNYTVSNHTNTPLALSNITDDKLGQISTDTLDYALRTNSDLQVLYRFDEAEGNTVNDVSGVGTALNLAFENTNYSWNPSSLDITAPNRVVNTTDNNKVFQSITTSNELTVEAWIKPANNTQGGAARIVTLSANGSNRNFQLMQNGDIYQFRLRTSDNGTNQLSTNSVIAATPELQHVVYTFDGNTAKFYINGNQVNTSGTQNPTGDFSTWDANYDFGIANEFGPDAITQRDWLGEFHLAAVYSKALSSIEILNNYQAGTEKTSTAIVLAAGQSRSYDTTYTVQASDFPSPLVNIATISASDNTNFAYCTTDTATLLLGVPACPFTCNDGTMLSWDDMGWNNNAGWTDHSMGVQTFDNYDGMGNDIIVTYSGNSPSGGSPGPNVYTNNPENCDNSLRLTGSNTSTSIAEFPTESIAFETAIQFNKMYVGGMEQRNSSGRAEVSVLSFRNNGVTLDPSGFTFAAANDADVDYQIHNNQIYVYGTTIGSDGLLSIIGDGSLVDEIVWAVGEISNNTIAASSFNFTGGASSQYITPICYEPGPIECDCSTPYNLCWDESGFVEPPNDDLANFPYSNTMTDIDGSGVDLTVTLFQPSRDNGGDTDPQQSYVSPGSRCGCTFDDELGPYLSCGEVFRNWSRFEPTPDTVIMNFSEPIRLPKWGFGGFKTSNSNVESAVASFTFYDGPNATGNKVVSSLADPGGRAQINVGDPTTAAINELQGTGMGTQETELYDGTYYYEGQDNNRGWTILDMGTAAFQSIMVIQYTVEDGLSPQNYVPIQPTAQNNSGYWASFDFEKCACENICPPQICLPVSITTKMNSGL